MNGTTSAPFAPTGSIASPPAAHPGSGRPGLARLLLALLPALGSTLAGAPVLSQEAAGADRGHAVEIQLAVVRGNGDRVSEVEVGDLEVTVRGRPVPSIELLPSDGSSSPRMVVYVDHSSARPASVQRLATSLLGQAEEIAALGPIEVVEADPVPRPAPRVLRRDDLERILNRLFLRREPSDEVAAIRGSFLRQVRAGREAPLELAEAAYRLEVESRQRQVDRLLEWVASEGAASGARALVLLNDNLALDARSFYLRDLQADRSATLRWPTEPDSEELGRALAALGWVLVVLGPSDEGPESRLSSAASPDLPVGFRLRLGGRRSDPEEAPAADLGWGETVPQVLRIATQATGGAVLTDPAALPSWTEGLAGRLRLRLAGLEIEPGEVAALRVEAAGSLRVEAPSWIGRGTPEPVAAMRARKALAGDATDAEIQVRSAIEFDPERIVEVESRLEARLDLFELRQRLGVLDRGSFRVTVGVHLETDELLLRHEIVPDVPLAGRDEWLYEGALRLPAETDGAVVVVELLETGDWGESFASFMHRAPAVDSVPAERADRSGSGLLPGRQRIRLVPPEGGVLLGKVAIGAEADPSVARIVYTLDGKKVATRRRAPWGASVDVGNNPRQRMLVAIGYDRQGREIARDGLLINDVARTFNVQIKEPRAGRRIGPVDVQAEVNAPDGAVVSRMEFFWQDQLVSTVRRPPWRQRLFIPVAAQPGFIRVAAHLQDGRIAEDVVLMNADEFEEQVIVNLVELYVVVTDRGGKPVRDLERDDFEVREEGVVQAVESFDSAGDLPITVGLALDSSLSLFLKLPDVQAAASSFVDGLIRQRDQAFLVGFSTSPRVVRATTGNLENIVSGIESLTPEGTTALWEAVVLSLLQLQEASGRKALVVFYDGDDEDEDFSFGTALRLSRNVGVPIYLVVMNNAAARSGGQSFGTKNRADRLERIARAGGGRVYYVRTDDDLEPIFASITQELRSHYLLTYYPAVREGDEAPAPDESPWRPIEVKVKRPGLVARTLSGYEKL